jgi:flagellar biosynthesis regulator FlbT
MPLEFRVKPGHRLFINGVVVENSGPRATQLRILNRATVLLEDDVMMPEQAQTPLEEAYLAVQMMHLDPERHDEFYDRFITAAARGAAQALAADRSGDLDIVQEAVAAVGRRNFPVALLRLQKLIGGKPGRARNNPKMPDSNLSLT